MTLHIPKNRRNKLTLCGKFTLRSAINFLMITNYKSHKVYDKCLQVQKDNLVLSRGKKWDRQLKEILK